MRTKGSARADRLKNGSPRLSTGRPDRSNNQKSMKVKLMKRISYLFVALVSAAALISCQKENADNGSQKGDAIVFSAYVDGADPESKTVFGEAADGKVASLWSGTEYIWVMDGSQNKGNSEWKKQYHAELGNVSSDFAVFSQTVTDGELTGGPYWALYPAKTANDASWAGGNSKVTNMWLNPSQNPSDNGYNPEYHIAVSYSTDEMLYFKNIVSFFAVTVDEYNVTRIRVKSNNGEIMSGNFDITLDEDKVIEILNNGNVQQPYAGVEASETQAIKKGTTYYISALPTTFEKGITLEAKVNQSEKVIKSSSVKYSLGRNTILNLGTVNCTQTVYLVGPWPNDNAYLELYYWGVDYENNKTDGWVEFTQVENNVYSAELPSIATGCIFYRRESAHTKHSFDEGTYWNKSGGDVDLTKYNCMTVASDWSQSFTVRN